jgi:hypothetical protein
MLLNNGSEILVVLRPGVSPPAEILAWGGISHSISERVFTLAVDSADRLASLQANPAVYWAGTRPPDTVLDELTTAERLFIDGSGKPERSGEGLDWDTPGRLPP